MVYSVPTYVWFGFGNSKAATHVAVDLDLRPLVLATVKLCT